MAAKKKATKKKIKKKATRKTGSSGRTTTRPSRGKSAREALRQKLIKRENMSPRDRWMAAASHAAAREFVELWLDMAADGESTWSARRVLRELISEYDYPYTDPTGFVRWMQSRYGARYLRAVGRIT